MYEVLTVFFIACIVLGTVSWVDSIVNAIVFQRRRSSMLFEVLLLIIGISGAFLYI